MEEAGSPLAGNPAITCKVCGGAFKSKNKLFKHLKSSDDCQVPSKAKALFPKKDKGEPQQPTAKKARTGAAAAHGGKGGVCGRCHVSIAQQDFDVEPDGALLPEKLRLIKLAGVDTEEHICVCGCQGTGGAAGDLIPAEVMKAVRVLAMTETELYFAGGPTVEAWAASDCKGMSIRNEIRALNHLRKLIR
jgi:hypothetical protein